MNKKLHIFDDWQLKETPLSDYEWHHKHDKSLDALHLPEKLAERLSNYPASLQQYKHFWYGYQKKNIDVNHHHAMIDALAQKNIERFIRHLSKHRITTSKLSAEEQHMNIDKIISKYNSLMRLLTYTNKRNEHKQFLFTLALDFFDYCFHPKTHQQFKKLLTSKSLQPLARLLYSIIWVNLGSKGWSAWHKKMLDILKSHADQGTEIVYIAGGTDFYQLIKHGIYNIRIIDPFLPTQDTYYSEGWRALVGGRNRDAIGDIVEIPHGKTTLLLKRTSYKKTGTFRAQLSNGTKRTLPQSTTKWHIIDHATQKKLGTITIERRFVDQKDFNYNPNKLLLLSYNELYFITAAGDQNWGINVKQFDPRIKLYIKQLRKPLSKSMLINMHRTDQSDLEFIQLGSCAD